MNQESPLSARDAIVEAVRLRADHEAVTIVDQTRLPAELVEEDLADAQAMWDAIYQLKVRGAPAIGVTAAWCLYVLARQEARATRTPEEFRTRVCERTLFLDSARPTAVNLHWALERMQGVVREHAQDAPKQVIELLWAEARAIHDQNVAASDEISRLGASLLADGDGVLTHCNAGPLACLGYGTGQGPLYYAHDHGKHLRVYADETRPLLQGARLTSWELARAGIDVTLICDNMASIVMRNGWVQACMVGCDRVAANGDVANKIGTSGVAILAAHYGIPFYVLGPTSTIDLACPTGADIPIEERDGGEIREMHYAQPMAPSNVRCYNPSFDVTDHELVTAIITERGICRPPFSESLARCCG